MPEPAGRGSRVLFMVASVVMILTCVAHTAAQLANHQEPRNEAERRLMDAMSTVPIELPGARRVMLDLFNGFGWHYSLSMLVLGVIGLIMARGNPANRRVFAGAAGVSMAAFTVNSVIFFFIIPTALMGSAAVLYAATFLTSPKQPA